MPPPTVERQRYAQSDVESLASATRDQTERFEAIADRFEKTFAPAAKAVVELNEAQKGLCAWITSVKPWAIGLGVYLIGQYFPKLAEVLERVATSGISVPS